MWIWQRHRQTTQLQHSDASNRLWDAEAYPQTCRPRCIAEINNGGIAAKARVCGIGEGLAYFEYKPGLSLQVVLMHAPVYMYARQIHIAWVAERWVSQSMWVLVVA